jgi:ABC-type Fe3+ transport system permease subunit
MTDTVSRRITALLLLPATLWFAILLVLPLVVILIYSLGDRAPEGGYAPAFTLAQYANLPARWTAFQNTLTLAPLGTLLSLLAAYPVAYWLALRCPQRWRLFLLVLVIVPSGPASCFAPTPGSSSSAGAACRPCSAGWASASRALSTRLSLCCSGSSTATCR